MSGGGEHPCDPSIMLDVMFDDSNRSFSAMRE